MNETLDAGVPDPLLVQPPAQPPPPSGVIEVRFSAGPLGVGVGHLPRLGELTGYHSAIVNFPEAPGGGPGQAARYNYEQSEDSRRLHPGMLLVSIDGVSTHGLCYTEAVARLKAADRPVVLGFASQSAACEAMGVFVPTPESKSDSKPSSKPVMNGIVLPEDDARETAPPRITAGACAEGGPSAGSIAGAGSSEKTEADVTDTAQSTTAVVASAAFESEGAEVDTAVGSQMQVGAEMLPKKVDATVINASSPPLSPPRPSGETFTAGPQEAVPPATIEPDPGSESEPRATGSATTSASGRGGSKGDTNATASCPASTTAAPSVAAPTPGPACSAAAAPVAAPAASSTATPSSATATATAASSAAASLREFGRLSKEDQARKSEAPKMHAGATISSCSTTKMEIKTEAVVELHHAPKLEQETGPQMESQSQPAQSEPQVDHEPEVDPQRQQLERLARRLVFHPIDNTLSSSSSGAGVMGGRQHPPPFDLAADPNRMLLHHGELERAVARSFFEKLSLSSARKRVHLFLCSDLLLLTTPVKADKRSSRAGLDEFDDEESATSARVAYRVEDLATLGLGAQLTVADAENSSAMSRGGTEITTPPVTLLSSSFLLRMPRGTHTLVCPRGVAEKQGWFQLIIGVTARAIEAEGGHEDTTGVLYGWRHRLVVGTLHSNALHARADLLEEQIAAKFQVIAGTSIPAGASKPGAGSGNAATAKEASCDPGQCVDISRTSADKSDVVSHEGNLTTLGAFVSVVDVDGFTPLHYACSVAADGGTQCARCLLRSGADVTAINRVGATPLHVACAARWPPTMEALLSRGADPLHSVVTTSHESKSLDKQPHKLAQAAVPPVAVTPLLSLLFGDAELRAWQRAHARAVRVVRCGAPASTSSVASASLASSSGTAAAIEMAEAQAAAGAEESWQELGPDEANSVKQGLNVLLGTGLDIFGEEQIHGKDATAVSDNDGSILLDLAATGAHAHLAILLEAGADVNKRSGMSGSTPLIATCAGAAGVGLITTVDLLLRAGADALLADSHGRRPLQLLEARLNRLRVDRGDASSSSGTAKDAVRAPLGAALQQLQQWEQDHKGPSTWKKFTSWMGGKSKDKAHELEDGAGVSADVKANPGLSRAAAARMRQDAEHEQLMGGAAALRARRQAERETREQQQRDPSHQAASGVRGAKDAISQAVQGVNERGEKLNDLALKTAELKDAAADFATMARQLREAQEKKSFWSW